MDFLRRAFSLPQLFKDWDKSVKRKRAREQEVDELKVKTHFRRSCARRLSKVIVAYWALCKVRCHRVLSPVASLRTSGMLIHGHP